jgi:hypothetical protein
MKKVLDEISKLKQELVAIKTDQKWFKWILCGAAGLGFLEKCIGWLYGR